MKIAALILAAGGSTRMGKPKQLMPWKATNLIGYTIETANASLADQVYVVLGAEAEEIEKNLNKTSCNIIVNSAWQQGLGTSIQCGVKYLTNLIDPPSAIMILLADQPFIDSAYLNTMIAKYNTGEYKLIATRYGQKNGVPAIFDACFYEELSRLEGDKGAAKLLVKYKDVTQALNAENKTMDLDTPEDYAKFKT